MYLKQLAWVLCVAFVVGIAAPAHGQPFADTPANHWAYEALAQLAAKGLIQGYPGGTFKGDRTMTRYEMAMVVARLLARIEQLQVRRTQLQFLAPRTAYAVVAVSRGEGYTRVKVVCGVKEARCDNRTARCTKDTATSMPRVAAM